MKLAWKQTVGTGLGSPVLDGGRLFVAGGATMTAFAASDGTQVWQKNPVLAGGSAFMAESAIIDDKVVVPYQLISGGGLLSFDPAKGTYTSSSTSPAIAYNAPVVGDITAITEKEIQPSGALSFVKYGSRKGLIGFWPNAAQQVPSTTPMISGSMVYVGSGTSMKAFSTTSCPAAPISGMCAPIWSRDLGSTTTMPVAISTTRIAVSLHNGNVAVLDSATGVQKFVAETGTTAIMPPAVDDSHTMYVGGADGMLRAFRSTGCGSTACLPLWTTKQRGAIVSQPVVAGGVVYVGTNSGRLLGFDATGCSGSTPCTWLLSTVVDYHADAVIPIEDRGSLYAVTDTGTVSAYRVP